MSLISGSARHIWKAPKLRYLRQPSLTHHGCYYIRKVPSRCFSAGDQKPAAEELAVGGTRDGFWDEYKRSFTVPKPSLKLQPQISQDMLGKELTIVGFLGNKRDASAKMTFADLHGEGGSHKIQLFAKLDGSNGVLSELRAIPPKSAVSVTGTLALKFKPKNTKASDKDTVQPDTGHVLVNQLEIVVRRIECINSYPSEFEHPAAEDRHLQIRFNPELKSRLEFRAAVASFVRNNMTDFMEIETPILFKSTPEGAREFLVPTRTKGHAYSLPQSPQQYKQLLMASGIHRYMQFAKCFRDEDHRADRQPEFTQLDLEMSWADGEDVMNRVERLMKELWVKFSTSSPTPTFQRMRYQDAMQHHGSDKPDLRIPGSILRIDHIINDDLRSKLSSLDSPIVEAWKIRIDASPKELKRFISEFMDSAEGAEFRNHPDSAPGVFVYEAAQPLQGLAAFGPEAATELEALFEAASKEPNSTNTSLDHGDIILVQARPDKPHSGGSTTLGRLRRAFHNAATKSDLELPQVDPEDRFLWVTDFPLFTSNEDTDGPNDQGTSGFSATHHPFTAPKSAADVDLLLTDPLSAVADHYDLVLNGIELGGGSRRIHSSEMQQFIMRDILKMNENRLDSFTHLFRALRAGCPPHAGFAIGFDRLIAVMTGRESVRDVIAFPKDKAGRDTLVKSPGPVSSEELSKYHIKAI